MASTTPYDRKYSRRDFMDESAGARIKNLMKCYLERIGVEEAGEASKRMIIKAILSDDMYAKYEKEDAEKAKTWRKWVGETSKTLYEDMLAVKDATNADAIHAPRVVSGAAADGTGMPAQSPSSTMLHHCKEQARKLSTQLQSMHKDMEHWHAMGKSLMEKHTEFALRFDELHMQLSKAVDAQGVGAAGLAQISVPPPGKAATADAGLATSSGAKAASDAKIRETKKMVSDIFTDISGVFRLKYLNYPGDVSTNTQHQHVRAYCRKFLSKDMQKLTAQDPNNTNMTWRSVFWLSLLYKFDDQVNKYLAQNPPPYQIETEKQKIEQRADACKSIFIAATQGFESKWDIRGSPGGKEDTFEKEIEHISSAFVRLGIACDPSRIERPVAAETPSRKKKHGSVDGDGGQASGQDGFDGQPAQNVKREENSNGDVTEAEESDDEIVCLSD